MSTPDAVARDLVQLAATTNNAVHKTVVAYGAHLQTAAKRHAHEPRTAVRPRAEGDVQGPRFLGGDLNRSINRRTTRRAFTSTAKVGSSAPQARRIELGFTGTDSLGREFKQLPYPYLAPALREVEPKFHAALELLAVPRT